MGAKKNLSRLASFIVALSGLRTVLNKERNFQVQTLIALFVILLALFFRFDRFEWIVLLLTIASVLIAELINTVFEVVVDLAVKEKLLPEAKLAKDVSAAAVLLTAFFSFIIGLILFLPHIRQI